MKILYHDCQEIVKQLQPVVLCEIQKIAKYIFQKWLFYFCRKIYECVCVCVCVCTHRCICTCTNIQLKKQRLFLKNISMWCLPFFSLRPCSANWKIGVLRKTAMEKQILRKNCQKDDTEISASFCSAISKHRT